MPLTSRKWKPELVVDFFKKVESKTFQEPLKIYMVGNRHVVLRCLELESAEGLCLPDIICKELSFFIADWFAPVFCITPVLHSAGKQGYLGSKRSYSAQS